MKWNRSRRLPTAWSVSLLAAGALWLWPQVEAGASAPPGRYVISNGTVEDTVTGLIWQQTLSTNPCPGDGMGCTWQDAVQYCQNLSLGGFATGWRLPGMKEISSLVDDSTYGPAIDTTAFPTATSNWVWANYQPQGSNNAAVLLFYDGSLQYTNQAGPNFVRCVH